MSAQLVRLSSIQDSPLDWVWAERLPVGALANLSGDPAQAKTRISYDVAARTTTGQPMPGCVEADEPAGVIILQGEDAVATMVKPALAAAGADLDRIVAYDPTASEQALVLPDDLIAIEQAALEVHAKLLVVDPVSVFFRCNSNSEASVRQALRPLADFAANFGLAVLLVRHLTKANAGNPLHHGVGSIAWTAAARSELRCVNDPTSNDPHRHLLIQVKSNLLSAPTLAYRTVMTGGQVKVEWLGTSAFSVRDLFQNQFEDGSAMWEAAEVLYLILRHESHPAEDVSWKAKREGVSRRTLYRAKKLLRVKSERKKSNWSWHWRWRLPDEPNHILNYFHAKYSALDAADETAGNPETVATSESE